MPPEIVAVVHNKVKLFILRSGLDVLKPDGFIYLSVYGLLGVSEQSFLVTFHHALNNYSPTKINLRQFYLSLQLLAWQVMTPKETSTLEAILKVSPLVVAYVRFQSYFFANMMESCIVVGKFFCSSAPLGNWVKQPILGRKMDNYSFARLARFLKILTDHVLF